MAWFFTVEKFKEKYHGVSKSELVFLKHSIKVAKFNMHVGGICNAIIGLYYILFMNIWYVPVIALISVLLIAYSIHVGNKMMKAIDELME